MLTILGRFSYDEFLDNYNLSEMPSEVCEPTTYDIVALPPPGPIFPANVVSTKASRAACRTLVSSLQCELTISL